MSKPKIIALCIIGITLLGIGSFLFANKNVSPIGGIKLPFSDNVAEKLNLDEEMRRASNPVDKNKIAQANVKKSRVKFIDGVNPNSMAVLEREKTDSSTIVHRFTVADGKMTAELIDVMDKKYIINYVHDLASNTWWKKTEENKIEDTVKEIIKNDTDNKDKKDEVSPSEASTKNPPQITQESCPNNPALQCYKVINNVWENYREIIYFDTKDFLMRMASNNRTKDTTEYEYENINITIPSDAKEVPPGKNVLDYYHPTMMFVF